MNYYFKNILIPYLILISISSSAFQSHLTTADSAQIAESKTYINKAIALSKKTINDSSFHYLNSVKETSKKFEQWEDLVNAYIIQGYIYIIHKKYDNGIFHYKEALEIAKQKLPSNKLLWVQIYNYIGRGYYLKLNYYTATKIFLEAIKYHKDVGDNKNILSCYHHLTLIYLKTYDLEKATEFQEREFIVKNNLGIQGREIANHYTNLGSILHEKRENEKAILALNKSLEYYKKNNYILGLTEAYFLLGSCRLNQKKCYEALSYFEKGIQLGKNISISGKLNYKFIQLYTAKADAYIELNEYEKAHKANILSYKVADNKTNGLVNLSLGTTFQYLNNFDSALYCFQTGIIYYSKDFINSDVYSNPINLNVHNKAMLLKLLWAKTRAFYEKYLFEGSKNEKDLIAAYKTNILTLELVDMMLKNYESSGSRLAWSQYLQIIYDQSIRTALELSKALGEKKHLHYAFGISEKSKARVLLADIKTLQAKRFADIPKDLLDKENNLRTDLSFYQSQLQIELSNGEKQDSAIIAETKNKLFALKREKENLEKLLEEQFPKYYELKYDNYQPSVTDIQNFLTEDNTLVEYFMTDSTLYAFTITKDDFNVLKLNNTDQLKTDIEKIPFYLEKGEFNNYGNSAYSLYQELMEPLNISTNNIIIIPDGALWQLNFDLLISEKHKSGTKDFRDFAYLIKNHTINYAYSAKLLQQDRNREINPPKNECLAFSYNNDDNPSTGNYIAMRGSISSEMADLPGTRKEIKAVSDVVKGAYYYGSFANEKNFKENAKNYNILHLALHGVIDEKNPMNSKLYFTQNKDSVEDNFLHAHELYNLKLNAELAVLSACETGKGKLIKGEGIMSLGRAFTYAGCKSLIMSQWEISDQFTPQIMKNFYLNLKAGKSKAQALREAKLTYLENADNLSANPYYWAPLVQLGDNRPLQQKSYLGWAIGVSSTFILLGIAFYLKKRKS